MKRFSPSKTVEEYFWKRVQRSDSCWLWLGYKKYGYGLIRMGRNGDYIGMAHRFSWELRNGPIPEGLYALHYCNNPACVNPYHLYLGTQSENIAQAKREGRMARGEKQGGSKLTENDVINIRVLDLPRQKLADLYGVSYMLIKHVKNRKYWTHV